MRVVPVKLAANSYDIFIGKDVAGKIIEMCSSMGFSKKALIISDSNVAPLYGTWLKQLLAEAQLEAEIYVIEAGEASKSMQVAEAIYTRCIELGLDRKSPVFALGGGVVGDLAGFIAATYMRGVPFIQVPTSLLAQVDSSVGGKVAVNHKLGKNLIGAFYQPKAVFMDLNTMETLPEREIYTGLGEIIKYGIIYDEEFFQYLEENREAILQLEPEAASHMIARSCEIKAEVVAIDEKELGLRAILNFGHTAAHAIEKNTNYTRYNHGEAVAIGMICAADISRSLGFIDDDTFNRVVKLIEDLHLPVKAEGCQAEALYRDTFHDKKTVGGKVKWVVMEQIGKVKTMSDIDEAIIMNALRKITE